MKRIKILAVFICLIIVASCNKKGADVLVPSDGKSGNNSASILDLEYSGTVVDKDNNNPLPGVSVVRKGTNSGTFTGSDGKFTYRSTNAATVILVFKLTGYLSQEITTGISSNLGTIKLEPIP